MEFALIGVLLLISSARTSQEDWISKCGQCKCMWSDGKKTADCSNKHFSSILSDLSDEIRSLDFSNNPLYELKANAFVDSNLKNIQKLKLQNCSIEDMHVLAFSNLGLLIELDLSRNNIVKLDQLLFRENIKLRSVFLSYNKLEELRGGLFHNMPHLQRVFVNNNRLEKVDSDIFDSGPALQYIDFSENRLKHLDYQMIKNLKKISSVNVQGNPWVCDCTLKKFRDIVMDHTLVTLPTACAEPERLKGRLWSDLQSRDFACVPQILEPTPERKLEVDTNSNYTVSCKVQGDPLPDVDWVNNGRIIGQDPRQNQPKYVIAKNIKEDLIWNNLTIVNVNYRDRGEYKCVAKNPGGVEERNVSLVVYGDYKGSGGGGSTGDLFLYIGLTIGAIVLIIIIILLICCYCKRSTRQTHSKSNDANQSTDYISLNGRPEHEKTLITEVNPLVKPPRQYSVPPSVTSGVTEVSDIKKTLLDDDSTFGVGDEDSRSFDYDTRPRIPIHHLDPDYRGDNQQPDLLAFPARGVQVSPAGSTASTVVDHTRLPPHHGPQSPLHSPLYDHVNLYRTLPYSRSQSPFTTPLGAPVVTPRAGAYVTIPRRPRASWSSEPLNPMFVDPVYDNLGLRTTAAGSSALSLNKLEGTPKIPRTTPSTTSYSSVPCDPIAEHDTLGIPTTLPRNSVAHRALSPTNDWNRLGSETSSVRSTEPDSRRQSTSSLLPSTPDGKIAKIPPRPPPKPKKRVSTGPLFEDEGEDGTEV